MEKYCLSDGRIIYYFQNKRFELDKDENSLVIETPKTLSIDELRALRVIINDIIEIADKEIRALRKPNFNSIIIKTFVY